jgi:cellulose synthase/poly-beta-1,6-N-acetylglucosamine synthase-like glycosyltransferase
MVLEQMNGLNDLFTGGVLGGAVLALGITLVIILGAAVYIYTALAWSAIAKKLKYKLPWLAWIPFANLSMMLQLGGFSWAWIFLILIPILGWIGLMVLLIIATWKVFEKRKYPGWFSLSVLIPQVGYILYLIAIGLVAWRGKK